MLYKLSETKTFSYQNQLDKVCSQRKRKIKTRKGEEKGVVMIILPDISLPELQKQPAGIDLSVDKIFIFSSFGIIDYTNHERKVSDVTELKFDNDWLFLRPGVYKVLIKENIKVPDDCLGIALPRSSLVRSGVSVKTGFWDPGYEGKSEVLLTVHNVHGLKLKKGARILQLTFMKLEKPVDKTYNGQYHNENLEFPETIQP